MTPRGLILLVLASTLGVGAFFWWSAERAGDGGEPVETARPGRAAAEPTAPLGDVLPEAVLSEAAGAKPILRNEAERAVGAYARDLAFGDQVRDYVSAAPRLTRAERAARAEALIAEVKAREEDGRIVPIQSRYLRGAITMAAHADDPAERRRRVEAIAAERDEAAPPPDPKLTDYKTREREVLAEVLAMDSYPGGLSRNDYLRQRLDELRAEVWAD